jgi:Mor family transcriptional regulator
MIPFELVPENLYELYHLVGAELFTKIVDAYGGETLYIPKLASMERKKKHESIRKEYDGTNISHLAMKYDYTERTVREILFEGDSK